MICGVVWPKFWNWIQKICQLKLQQPNNWDLKEEKKEYLLMPVFWCISCEMAKGMKRIKWQYSFPLLYPFHLL